MPCGSGAGSGGLMVAALDGEDRPGPSQWLLPPGGLRGPTALGTTASGRILVTGAAASAARAGGSRAVLAEGQPTSGFAGPKALGGPAEPVAATSSYLGDAAIASVGPRGVELRLQRHFGTSFRAPIRLGAGAGHVGALAVALDYRSDALVVWEQGGRIFARERHAAGPLEPAQEIGRSGPRPQLQALISDDGRAIVAWTDEQPTGGSWRVRTYLDVSGPGVRFGRPRMLEAGSEPARQPRGALRLIRLSTENVVIGWTGAGAGAGATRIAPVTLNGLGSGVTLSSAATDATLADLSAGPHGDMLALWTSVPRSGSPPDGRHVTVLAAAGANVPGVAVRFSAPEVLAGPGPNADPRAAIDPSSDRAIAAWRSRGGSPATLYAVRAPGPA